MAWAASPARARPGCTQRRARDSSSGQPAAAPEPVDLAPLHAKIGQLALENDFLSGALGKAGLLASAKR